MLIFIRLYYEFFKIGLFTIGGGLATIPFLKNLSERTAWFTQTDLINMIAISESTPGAIGINMATYTGYLTAGCLGSIIATVALITPSIIVIFIITTILKKFKESNLVKAGFYGLRAASTGLILAATFGIIKISFFYKNEKYMFMNKINIKALILGIILFLIIRKKKMHPIIIILFSGFIGIILKF